MKFRLLLLLLVCVSTLACKQKISIDRYSLPTIPKEVRQETHEEPIQKSETGYTIGITSGWAAID